MNAGAPSKAEQDAALAAWLVEVADDPERFVDEGYPWGEPGGPLANHDGPDAWQRTFLQEWGAQLRANGFDGATPVPPIKDAVSSGHGIGKSALVAWIVDFIMSTRPNCQGTVTANTFTQLETKTWAAVARWTKWCITAAMFVVTTTRMYHPDFKESWFCALQSSRAENSEAFAGQHAADSTSFYVFDEASAIPDVIFEVAEGGLTDGESMSFQFGNPTRNTGHFHKSCFGSLRDRWHPTIIDSRTCKFPNKALIDEWLHDYGEDSDFFRVRVRGLPPRASELQFIDQQRIWDAQKREGAIILAEDAMVAGVDVSGGGAAWNVVRFRRGADARSITPIRIPGEQTRGDRSTFLAVLAEVLAGKHAAGRVDMMFVDSAFGSPYVVGLKAMGYTNVTEVNFGGHSPDHHQANRRANMYDRCKTWLLHGMIKADDVKLEMDLTGPGYHINKQMQLVIESKESMQKRGVASPDDGDALVLTFAAPVRIEPREQKAAGPFDRFASGQSSEGHGWMG